MRTINLKTKEPIKIQLNLSDYGNDHSIDLIYKGKTYIYAWLTQHSTMTLDLDALKHWVEETYYSLDFTCPQYVPCEIRAENFKK